MKKPLSILLFSVLLASASAQEIPVSLKVIDGRSLSGDLVARVADGIHFKQTGSTAPIKVPNGMIAGIRFRPKGLDEKELNALFDTEKFRELAERYESLYAPALPYASLLTGLDRHFLQWMIAAYWIGDNERMLQLAPVVEKIDNPEYKAKSRYYRGLAQIRGGSLQDLELLLSQSDTDTIYPPGTSARLYLEARLLQMKEQPLDAIQIAALLIAEHGNDTVWMPQAELLCTELYFQLDMPESAQAVLADINEFYADPEIKKKAAALAAQNNGEKK